MEKIEVRFNGWGQDWLLATLASTGRQTLFEYSPEAIERGLELSSPRLRLRALAYGEFPAYQYHLPGLIADALPDGWGLLLMNRFFKKYFDQEPYQVSALQRLTFIGNRAMGALSFAPAAELPLEEVDLRLLSLANEVKEVIAGRDAQALKHLVLLGGSPHGARPKALVQYEATTGEISTLEAAPGEPWMVKFPAKGEHKEVCAIEHLYAEMARECGLDMPATRYFDLDKNLSAFAIARFDREAGMRVPVQSLAAVLHLDFRIPSVDCQALLRTTRAMTNSEQEVMKAFQRCVFNVVFHNRDDHSKNFAFRMDANFHWKLAPCYDLSFSHGPGGEHQMAVEGEAMRPARAHLLKLAQSNGLDVSAAQAFIARAVGVAQSFRQKAKELPIRASSRTQMAKAIDENCTRML